MVSLALYVAVGSTENYLRDHGPFSKVVWMEALALSVAAVFLSVGLAVFAVVLRYPRVPRAAGTLDHTPLGAPCE